MTAPDLRIIAQRAINNAFAIKAGSLLTDAAIEATRTTITELRAVATTGVSEREIYHATGILLQSTGALGARYLQYRDQHKRAEAWRNATFAFVDLVNDAVAREGERVS
jgi:hypothetical protein